jgi:hypothetical protein
MFEGAALSTHNYDALLNGWGAQTLQSGVYFDAGGSSYCAGGTARDVMTGTYDWRITDGGRECSLFLPLFIWNITDGGNEYSFFLPLVMTP